jgi:N-acetylmuramoyl-L-alanine amidase/GAF domain-containing protein
MSATVNNASLELIKEETAAPLAPRTRTLSPTACLGHEALQALLAFSALHEEIRTRRAKPVHNAADSGPEEDWQNEQFVLDEVLQLVAERALAITGADGVAIALAKGDAIVCRASAGSIAPDAGVRLDPNAGFSGQCLVSGRIVRSDDADSDARVNLPACRRLGIRSMLAVPLSAKGNVIGLLEAFSKEPYGFNDSDVRSLSLLAELILSAMKPEEEDRLSEISRRVVHAGVVEGIALPVTAPALVEVRTEASAEHRNEGTEPASTGTVLQAASIENSESVSLENSKLDCRALALAGPSEPRRLRPGLTLVAALVSIALALGAGLWWTLGHRARSLRAGAHSISPVAAPSGAPPASAEAASTALAAPKAVADDESESSPTTPEEAGLLPKVTGIRHWSSADSSTVVIDIGDQVQYEAHRLPNPERIYFDLHDTTLGAARFQRNISVNDALLERIRIAQPVAGVTRVVLETHGPSDFSVSLEPNPYRLVVEVRKRGTKAHDRAKVDLFAPANPNPGNQVAENEKLLPTTLNLSPMKQIPQAAPAISGNAPRSAPLSRSLEAGSIPTPLYLRKFRIVLDAGHGGWDLGGVGRHGLLEKDLVLDIAERLGHLVESRLGAEVIYTRTDDSYLALERRAEIANLAEANLFVSVHANYSDYPSARGVETYYTNTYSSVRARTEDADEAATAAGLKTIDWTKIDIREKVHASRRVAISVQRALYTMLVAKHPGLRNRGVKEAHYVVLTGTSMPAILAEVSFVSSPTDENNLQGSTYRQQIAEALYSGIAHYRASNRNLKLASASAKPAAR